MWPEFVHQVYRVCGLPEGAGQGQLLSMFCPRHPSMNYKEIWQMLLLVLDLEVSRRGQAVNQGQLLLVLGLGPFSKRYGRH